MTHCALCGKPGPLFIHRHHLFSQTKINKKLYPEYIHRPENIMIICADCHLTKTIPKLSEREFCAMFKINPRSKTERFKNG